MNSTYNNKLVSFVLISYNQEKYIEDALLSVLEQDYSNLEIIVSDDGSTDNTKNIIKRHHHNNFIFLDNQENKGLIGNLNHAFSYINGEYVVVMAGDDISLPHRTSTIVKYFDNNPDINCIYSNTLDINPDSEEIPLSAYGFKYYIRNKNMNIHSHLLNDLGILGCSAAFRKFLLEKPLPDFLPSEDKLLTLRALINGRIGFINEKLVKYRLGTGISNNLNKKESSEYLKLLKGRILTIDGYISELSNINNMEKYITLLKRQRKFLESSLQILQDKRYRLPDFYFDFKNISFRDKLKFIYYRYF
ncbi:glycosyltransferase [Morganella sp. GD04133]|uniref:glycosyltransferase n=1 Tax=Morganella sp. GD04133 TaxID=2975435 RepID=UPI00244A5ACD|nr:glycosyltransferase [Morganella sp. GD04133]MDH0353983.1 glycosyltransferase [Morganella sp. GD04133]